MTSLLLGLLRDLFRPSRDLVIENLSLRQQMLVLERTNPRPLITELDRTFWVLLSRLWADWRRPLRIVQPETVIAWHRRVWRFWWRWKSRDVSSDNYFCRSATTILAGRRHGENQASSVS